MSQGGSQDTKALSEQRDRAWLNPYMAGQLLTTVAHHNCASQVLCMDIIRVCVCICDHIITHTNYTVGNEAFVR